MAQRRRAGRIVWLTGLSGAGKTTLSRGLAERLRAAGTPVELLDGDDVRAHLSAGLGFTRADRDRNVARIGFVARLLARHGVTVLVAAISPYQSARDRVRADAEAESLRFFEVHVHCPLPVLCARDTKGLYRRALGGAIAHFTGISDPYEVPANPELRIDTDGCTVAEGVARLLGMLDLGGHDAEGGWSGG